MHYTAMKGGWVYIMTNRTFGTLYVGVTSDLERRMGQHKAAIYDGFTCRYHLTRLMWSERHEDIVSAIRREKAIKHWPRAWKLDLVTDQNPNWDDLAGGIWSESTDSTG